MPKEKKTKEKKKGKKYEKKKGVGTGKKKDAVTKKKKGPTEKELFEMQVERLKHEHEAAGKSLGELDAGCQQTMELLQKQVDRKEAVVSHLKGLFAAGNERFLTAQDRLQEQREMAELVERRVFGKVSTAARGADAARSLFLQQKMELEGKLSLLEELRLKRSSLKARLGRAEAALEERERALRAEERDGDSAQVERLLRGRGAFLRACARTCAERRSALGVRLSAAARRGLGENLRLRGECHAQADRLLSAQELRRSLGRNLEAARLEREVRQSADRFVAWRSSRLEEDIERVRQIVDDLEKIGTSQKRMVDEQQPLATEESFRGSELEYCRLLDRGQDLSAVLLDQSRHRASLVQDLAKSRGANDAMFSAMRKARRVFRERCFISDSAPPEGVDFEVLRQIRRLLDLGEEN